MQHVYQPLLLGLQQCMKLSVILCLHSLLLYHVFVVNMGFVNRPCAGIVDAAFSSQIRRRVRTTSC